MLATESNAGPLTGYTVALTAGQATDLQAVLMSSQGIDCMTVPLTQRHPAAPDALADQTRQLAGLDINAVLFTSGLGVELWFKLCAVLGISDTLRSSLAGTTIFALGHETRSALAANEQSSALVDAATLSEDIRLGLSSTPLQPPRLAVQVGGSESESICASLEDAGFLISRIEVYTATPSNDSAAVARLFQAITEHRLSALTFLTADDVASFIHLADSLGVLDALTAELTAGVAPRGAAPESVQVFCLDTQTANALTDHGITNHRVPTCHGLGEFVHLVTGYLSANTQVVQLAGHAVRIQGNTVTIGGELTTTLTERERSVLKVLVSRNGVVCSKEALLKEVWGSAASDTHAVEVGIARLRRTLGPAGAGIETVVRRGYRIRTESK